MFTLQTIAMLAMDMVGTLKIAGFVVGIPLIIIWLVRIKNTVALFYDKKKVRATVFLGIPGIILVITGIFLVATTKPMRAYIYLSNSTDKEGRVEVDGSTFTLAAESWKKIEVRSLADTFAIKGYAGDSLVFDTTMGEGSYIGNLGGSKAVIAEEVEYSAMSIGSGADLEFKILMTPGIEQFSTSLKSDIYDFDEAAPNSLKVSSYSSKVRKWDLQLKSQEALFQNYLDALGEEGMNFDSLMNALEEDSLEGDYEDEEDYED